MSGLLVAMPNHSDQPLHWWRVQDGGVVASGHDTDVTAADGERVVALISVTDAPLYTLPAPDLPVKQAEAVAARQLAARSLSQHAHAFAKSFDDDPANMQGAMVDPARLTQGLALLTVRGLSPDFAVPAAMVARHIWWHADAEAVQLELMGEVQWASAIAVHPADVDLSRALSPNVVPMHADEAAVADAIAAVCANPAPNALTAAFAPKAAGRGISTRQGRTLFILLAAALLVTLAIGIASWWRFADAAQDADARALAALSKALGPQNDLTSGESALDAQLAREGRGATVMSAPLSALYTAMQDTPQVSLRQLRYTPDGTMLATISAPTSEAANAILARLQRDGYKVTATARTDDSGAQVVDVTIRGY